MKACATGNNPAQEILYRDAAAAVLLHVFTCVVQADYEDLRNQIEPMAALVQQLQQDKAQVAAQLEEVGAAACCCFSTTPRQVVFELRYPV